MQSYACIAKFCLPLANARTDCIRSAAMGTQVEMVEVGPRDGLQSDPRIVPTAAKIELIAAAAGRWPASHRGRKLRQSAAGAADGRRRASAGAGSAAPRGVTYIGLVLNRKGFERAVAAGCSEVGMAVVASDTFNRRNQGVGTDESIAAWLEIARAARAAGIRAQVTISAAFGCPFEGEVPVARVVDVAQRVSPKANRFEIASPTRSASRVPAQVDELARRVRASRCPACRCAATSTTRAIPASPTPGPRSRPASARSIRASAASAAVRSRRPRPATSPQRICSTCLRAAASNRRLARRAIETAQWLQEQLGRPVPGMLVKAGGSRHSERSTA